MPCGRCKQAAVGAASKRTWASSALRPNFFFFVATGAPPARSANRGPSLAISWVVACASSPFTSRSSPRLI